MKEEERRGRAETKKLRSKDSDDEYLPDSNDTSDDDEYVSSSEADEFDEDTLLLRREHMKARHQAPSAFNPAALRANLHDVRDGGMILLNTDAFSKKAWNRAGYSEDPLPELRQSYEVYEVPVTSLNRSACQGLTLGQRDVDRCKNFFALGLLYWLYSRPMKYTETWFKNKLQGDVMEANLRALRALSLRKT